MNSFAIIRFYTIILFVLPVLASCQKEINPIVPAEPPPGRLPDSVSVSMICTLPADLEETSGLCGGGNGTVWTFGDSGNPNTIYNIDTATGAILQAVTIANYINIDWEDIAADANYLYVGDVGNNLGFRKDLKILRIKKSDITPGVTSQNVNAEAIQYSYADQTDFSFNNQTNFNCEAIIAAGDSLYLFSKNGSDSFTRCYALPKQPGRYVAPPVATFNTEGSITAAAYNASTKELALLGYLGNTRASFVWFFNSYSGNNFFAGNSRKFTIGTTTTDWQTEALEYISADRLLMSCEKSASHDAALYYVQKQ